MRSLAASCACASVAVALWLLWNYEHEFTDIRAPWTGATYVASLCAFAAVGYLGRGWGALLVASLAAVAAILVDPLIWNDRGVAVPETSNDDCDPGCISTEWAAIMAAVGAALVAGLGIVLRRAVSVIRGRVRRSRPTHAALDTAADPSDSTTE